MVTKLTIKMNNETGAAVPPAAGLTSSIYNTSAMTACKSESNDAIRSDPSTPERIRNHALELLRRCEDDVTRRTREAGESVKAMDEIIKRKNNELASVKVKIAEWEGRGQIERLRDAKKDKQALMNVIQGLKTTVDNKNKEIADLESRILKGTDEINEHKTVIANMKARVRTLEMELAEAKVSIAFSLYLRFCTGSTRRNSQPCTFHQSKQVAVYESPTKNDGKEHKATESSEKLEFDKKASAPHAIGIHSLPDSAATQPIGSFDNPITLDDSDVEKENMNISANLNQAAYSKPVSKPDCKNAKKKRALKEIESNLMMSPKKSRATSSRQLRQRKTRS